MPARANGPKSGKTLGNEWAELPVNKPHKYTGTANGAKANAYRANLRYPTLRFRTYQKGGEVFIERLQ